MEPTILTFTGTLLNPLNVKPEDIDFKFVAHHLALINRFNGSTKVPSSVAQHVWYVSHYLEGTGYEYQGLHHDDGESIVGDTTKWIKEHPMMEHFREVEDNAQRACYTAAGILPSEYEPHPKLMHPLVNNADKVMLVFEGSQCFDSLVWDHWMAQISSRGYLPLKQEELARIGPWTPWSWEFAEMMYLQRHEELKARISDGS